MSFDHRKEYEKIRPVPIQTLASVRSTVADVAVIVKSIIAARNKYIEDLSNLKAEKNIQIDLQDSLSEWSESSGAANVVQALIGAFLPHKEGLMVSHWFGAKNKCQQFFSDFALAVDVYGEWICCDPRRREETGIWRHALQLMLEAEGRLGAGDRVLTPFGAWAVTIAHTFNFPAAVSHHIDAPILSVDPKATGLSLPHYCRYFYHLGLIAAEYGRFEEACCHFETVLEVRDAVNVPFGLEANNALIIVSAVARGEVAPSLVRTAETATYERFATTFLSASSRVSEEKAILRDIERYSRRESGLANLARVCLSDRLGNLILRLTKVYANLPLAEIAKSVGISEAEAKKQIDLLNATGKVRSFFDATTGIVHFSEVSSASREEVEESIRRAISLSNHVENVLTCAVTSRDYIRSTPEFQDRVEREVAIAVAR